MKRFLCVFAAALALASCERDFDDGIMVCGGYEVTMDFPSDDGDVMHAVINGDALDLELTPAASGARYQGSLNDTVVVLWQKGENWTLMLDEDVIIECDAK